MNQEMIIELIKAVVLASVFFVWVVRYENIIKEFDQYQLPPWLRDLVGIIKLTSVYLINFGSQDLSRLGALAIAILMFAAMVTHLKVKNPVHKLLPSTTLCIIGIVLFIYG